MNITIDSGNTLLLIFAVIFAVIILMMVLRRGQRRQKLISIVILVAVFAVVYFIFGRPSEITMDETGLKSKAYGKIEFEWDDVESTQFVENYEETGWDPKVKINGSAMPGLRTGRFRLENGETAKLLTQTAEDALVFTTEDGIYLFAVDDIDKMMEYSSKYISITE